MEEKLKNMTAFELLEWLKKESKSLDYISKTVEYIEYMFEDSDIL